MMKRSALEFRNRNPYQRRDDKICSHQASHDSHRNQDLSMLYGEAATTILEQDESKMNKVYRVVWNAVLGVWQVASELVKSHGKTKSRKAIGLAIGIAGGSLLASAATAAGLPTGGNIVAGDGSIQQGGNNM